MLRLLRPMRLLRRYNDLVLKYPTAVMSATSGVSMGLGNFICQVCGENKELHQIDYSKIFRFSMFAFLIAGPIGRYWVYALDLKIFRNRNTKLRALKMMLLDQSIMPFLLNALFLTQLYYFETYNLSESVDKMKTTITPIVIESYKVWPAAVLFNFYLVPLQHRILFGNVVALFWNIYLSYLVRNE